MGYRAFNLAIWKKATELLNKDEKLEAYEIADLCNCTIGTAEQIKTDWKKYSNKKPEAVTSSAPAQSK